MTQHFSLFCSAFCATAISARYWTTLPDPIWLVFSALVVAVIHSPSLNRRLYLFVLLNIRKRFPWSVAAGLSPATNCISIAVSGGLLGMIWMGSVGHWYLSWQLPTDKIQQDVIVAGRIDEIANTDDGQLLILSSASIDDAYFGGRIRLQTEASVGQYRIHQWVRFIASLKPAASLVNPSGSQQLNLLSKGIVANGFVKATSSSTLLKPASSLHYVLSATLVEKGYSRWLNALLTGSREQLTAADWQLLQRTGTAHLFAISGMHVGMVAVWCTYTALSVVVLWVGFSGRQVSSVDARYLTIAGVLILTAGFATAANWQVPVTRAWCLILLCQLLVVTRRKWCWHQLFSCMLVCCIIIAPLSVFGTSLYLSAGTLALVLILLWRLRSDVRGLKARIVLVCVFQLTLSLLILPLSVTFFGSVSLLVAPINLIAIPWVTLTLPVGLLGQSLSMVGWPVNGLLDIADASLRYLVLFLKWTEPSMLYIDGIALSPASAMMILAAIILLLIPAFRYQRLTAFILVMPALAHGIAAERNSWYLHVFDVGQGTALAITRGNRGFLIDTGPAFQQFTMFDAVVKPSLERLDITHVDHLIISHGDIDHAGGMAAATQSIRQHRPMVAVDTNTRGCHAGTHYYWQGLRVEYIWPDADNREDDNFHSCVVKVSDGKSSVLIPGDIPKTVEYELLYAHADIDADVLIAPHHGSLSSSSQAFINAVAPDYVIFTTAFMHRWQLPTASVVAKYELFGSRTINTAEVGYVRFRFAANEAIQAESGPDRWFDLRRLQDDD